MSLEKTFRMEIVTPDKRAFSREIFSLIVPAYEGYLGVLANHAPMMAELGAGKIQIKEPDGNKSLIVISGGFMDVNDNVVTILADSIDFFEEKIVQDFDGLNLAEADRALADARKRVSEFH